MSYLCSGEKGAFRKQAVCPPMNIGVNEQKIKMLNNL